MIRNAKLDGDIFTFDCPACGTTNSTDITEYDPQYVEEIGAYENFMVTCTNCRVMIGFNMQIPLFEAAESEGYFEYASDQDRQLREVIREIMWRRMPDLKEKNREIEEENYIKENGIGVPDPAPIPGEEPEPIPEPVPEPPADDPAPAAEEAEETPQLDIDREQLAEEINNAIEEAIQAEEGANKNE